jgi:uncharacterized protein YhaN
VRILELYLKAYGPFTEQRIDLSGSSHQLHVIFGENESGKSSALRALNHLLYGIPLRSTDDFLHDYAQMRIGGRLCRSDNNELAFLRKKGSKNTLRSYDDAETLDDGVLEPFLRGVPKELFTRFFGIDHRVLDEGGQSLLDYGGEVGKSLFAAGLGSGNLRSVLSGLETEAGEIFKPNASKPRINAAVAQLKANKDRIKEASLKGRDWRGHDRALRTAERELGAVERELKEQRTEQTHLDRLRSALPLLARRRQLFTKIQEMGTIVGLDDSFEERLFAALEMRKSAGEDLTRATQAKEKLGARVKELRLDAELLEYQETIELFRERLGSYKKAHEDLPRREGELGRLDSELTADLLALRPDLTAEELDELRAPLARRRQIQELANEHSALLARIDSAKKALRTGKERQERSRDKLARLPKMRDAGELRRVLKTARNLGDIDAQVSRITLRCERAGRECENALMALGLWTGSLDELERLAVPEVETVERFQEEFEELRQAREKILERKQNADNQIRDVAARLETLRKSGAVPTEEELARTRQRRDAGWCLVRRHWIEEEAIGDEVEAFAGGEPLADIYERSVSVADEVADRLRRETDRVVTQAELVTQRERFEKDIEEATRELAQLERLKDTLAERWRAAWQIGGIEPKPPREMLAWLRRQQKLIEAAASARRERDELRALVDVRATRQDELLTALRGLGDPFDEEGDELAHVLVHAEEVVEFTEDVEKRRTELKTAIDEGEAALKEARTTEAEAQERLQGWLDEWNTAVQGLGLDHSARPASALDGLDALSALFEKKRESGKLDDRIGAMKQDIQDFETAVRDFTRAHAPDLENQPVEQEVLSLGRMLSAVDKQETLRAQLRDQIEEETQRAEDAKGEQTNAEQELLRLRHEAQCSDDAGLEEALRSWQTHQNTMSKIEEIEEQLTKIGAGASIEQLETESEEVDADSLPSQVQELQQEIEELETRKSELMDKRATARSALESMDGSAQASEAAEEAQGILASLRRDVESYIPLRLARLVLQREIERYRKEHQTPLLVRAGELFRELTGGSFTSLQSHYGDDDQPQLVGVRRNDRKVNVSGMSSGARDQLFLALRLATLEEYVERSEPMPFVADDLLVNFDDKRTRAALEVLAQLGERMQVLLFTHHGRIREQAEELGEKADVSVLELGGA